MKTVFVYNPKSGSALSISELKKLTKKYSIEIDVWLPLDKNFNSKLKAIIHDKSTIYAYGGDGTIRAVASLLVDSTSVLVPLPGGTLNHFTKDLGISQDIETVLRQIHQWDNIKIDVASVNGEYFINNSSIGLYARSLRTREVFTSKLPKWPAATWATIKEIVTFRLYVVNINNVRVKTPVVFVGNNHYSLKLGKLGKRNRIDKGILSLYTAKADTRSDIARIITSTISGRRNGLIEQQQEMFEMQFKKSQVTVALDGEMRHMSTPLHYKTHPASLRIRVPQW